LCESREGYRNLCQLITKFKLRERTKGDGSAKLEEIQDYSRGLVCLTGGDEGPLAAALARGGEEAGRGLVERLVRIFGPQNVYVELQRHHEREEEWRNQAAIRIARSLKLPLLATNGVRYAHAYDREILDLFTSIRNHTKLDLAGRLLSENSQRHLRSASEMAALFADVNFAVTNTVELSNRLQFQLGDLGYEFPRYPVPDGETMDSFLRKRVVDGVAKRYGSKSSAGLLERAKTQVEHELALIAKLPTSPPDILICFNQKMSLGTLQPMKKYQSDSQYFRYSRHCLTPRCNLQSEYNSHARYLLFLLESSKQGIVECACSPK
jgi:error-prone DNA polymerase